MFCYYAHIQMNIGASFRMTTDQTLLEIIQSERIPDQATLLERLAEQGIELTQPTLSRHLRKLSVRKLDGYYQVTEEPVQVLPGINLESVPPNLLILKTDPGHAQMLGLHLDKRKPEGMAGTVAGDDTIFIAAQPDADLEELRKRVLGVFSTQGRPAWS